MSKKIDKSKENQQKSRNWLAVDAHFRSSAGPMRAKQDRRKKQKNNTRYLQDHWDRDNFDE